RPIQARQSGLLERSWRWCRRNRAVAGLLVAVAASLLLALVVGWVAYIRTTEALAREKQRRRDADAATQRAEANEALSLQALDEMFNEIEPPDELFQPGPGPAGGRPERPDRGRIESREKAALLQSILRFYDRFAAENATNSTLQVDAARANYRIGDIQQRLGEIDKAQAAYERALGAAEKLRAASPGNPDYTLLVSEIHGRLGMTLRKKSRLKEAEEHHRQALALAKSLCDLFTDSPSYRLSLSLARCALGECLLEQKQLPEARKLLEDAIAEAKACMRDNPNRRIAVALSTEYKCLSEILTALGEKTLAEAASRRAEEIAPGLPQGRPPPDPNRIPPPNRVGPRRGPE
ncbi:MAG: tetratricopeptide repeat protein, partial [Planctomycetota bacterium]